MPAWYPVHPDSPAYDATDQDDWLDAMSTLRGDWRSRCVCCGSSFATDPGDQAEVVNRATGSRAIAHAECYLNETDTYELA